MDPANPMFGSDDAVLLYALLYYDRKGQTASLTEMVESLDAIARYCPPLQTFSDTMNHLLASGLVRIDGDRFGVTDRSRRDFKRTKIWYCPGSENFEKFHRSLNSKKLLISEGSVRITIDDETYRAAKDAWHERAHSFRDQSVKVPIPRLKWGSRRQTIHKNVVKPVSLWRRILSAILGTRR
jgi:hypothetical protein